MLLHYFEIPLLGFVVVDSSKILRSHSAYMFSVDVADLVKECFVLDKKRVTMMRAKSTSCITSCAILESSVSG
jgi:hypothetical protein